MPVEVSSALMLMVGFGSLLIALLALIVNVVALYP
ncbi:putative holin-like toxin [Aneurinibacillus terranovensis]